MDKPDIPYSAPNKNAPGDAHCPICGHVIGTYGVPNVGPNHARNTFRDTDDPDFVIWESVGPCGHSLFSGLLRRDELPPPPIENVDLSVLKSLLETPAPNKNAPAQQHPIKNERVRKLAKIYQVMALKALQDPAAFSVSEATGKTCIEEQRELWIASLEKNPDSEPPDHWASPKIFDHSAPNAYTYQWLRGW